MNLAKKWLSLALAAAMLFTLAACSQNAVNTAVDLAELLLSGDEDRDAPDQELTLLPNESEATPQADPSPDEPSAPAELDESGEYSGKDEVALYIHLYGHLPSNYITKKDAEALGWPGGSLEPYAPGKSIGGSFFGNYEGILPTKNGRSYTECDIDTKGAKSRGAKRIVFSNDGLVYYTEDHYETFELLYGGTD